MSLKDNFMREWKTHFPLAEPPGLALLSHDLDLCDTKELQGFVISDEAKLSRVHKEAEEKIRQVEFSLNWLRMTKYSIIRETTNTVETNKSNYANLFSETIETDIYENTLTQVQSKPAKLSRTVSESRLPDDIVSSSISLVASELESRFQRRKPITTSKSIDETTFSSPNSEENRYMRMTKMPLSQDRPDYVNSINVPKITPRKSSLQASQSPQAKRYVFVIDTLCNIISLQDCLNLSYHFSAVNHTTRTNISSTRQLFDLLEEKQAINEDNIDHLMEALKAEKLNAAWECVKNYNDSILSDNTPTWDSHYHIIHDFKSVSLDQGNINKDERPPVRVPDNSDRPRSACLKEESDEYASAGEMPFILRIELVQDSKYKSEDGMLRYKAGETMDVLEEKPTTYRARNKDGQIGLVPKQDCQQSTRMHPLLWEQKWFHRDINRQQSETLLFPCSQGTFLIRDASKGSGHFVLSVKLSKSVTNFKIVTGERGYTLCSRDFKSICDIIDFYKNRAIRDDTCLTSPFDNRS